MLRRRLPFAVVESAPSCWSPRLDPGALRATACLKWSTGSTSSPPSRGSGQRVDVVPSSRAMQPNSCNRCGKGGDYQLACTMGRAWRTRQHFKCPGWITSDARSRRFANCKGGCAGGRKVTFEITLETIGFVSPNRAANGSWALATAHLGGLDRVLHPRISPERGRQAHVPCQAELYVLVGPFRGSPVQA